MISLRTGQTHEFANYNMRSGRELTYELRKEAVFFARHIRGTSLTEVLSWPYREFRSNCFLLGELLEKEWESPDE